MLPELSGFEVCEFMRAKPELSDVPILVMSARAKPMDRAFAEEVGATAYLVKPFKRSEFSRAVNALHEAGRGRRGVLSMVAKTRGPPKDPDDFQLIDFEAAQALGYVSSSTR